MAPVIFGSGDGSKRLLEILAENGMGMSQQQQPQQQQQQQPRSTTIDLPKGE